MKSLGQIAYEASNEGGFQNFGSWKKAPEVVRRVHENMAKAVAKAITKHRKELRNVITDVIVLLERIKGN